MDAAVSTSGASSTGRALLSRRRLRTLRALAERAKQARSAMEVCAIAAAVLGENAQDVGFVLIYLLDADKKRARLAGATRVSPGDPPATIELDYPGEPWRPLRETVEQGAVQHVTGLEAVLGARSGRAGRSPVREAVALPIAQPGQQEVAGFLLAGLNPRRFLDDDYRGFLELAAGYIAAVIASVRAYDGERKRAEALAEIERSRLELALMRDRVESLLNEVNRRKGEFLANMSHEIRSPMTAILGYSDILLMHLKDPDDVECVKTIKESGSYLLEIINDILDLSKMEAGKLWIKKEHVRLQPLFGEIQSLMAARAKEKGLPLILRYEGELPEIIETDRARLRQILINLLSNAVKFTEHGSVQMIAKLAPDEARLRIDVVDTGIGMSEELQSRLFDVFSQGDGSATRRFGGAGLGLAISKRLVEMLGGEITFKSAPGRGSTFTVTVPLGAIEQAAWRDFGETQVFAVARNISLQGYCVLVADDRTEIRYLLRQFLEDAGSEVITAANGLAALEEIQKAKSPNRGIDLVVMDMAMPGLDGLEATRRLRQSGFVRPVIALTAGAMEEERDKCLESGCDAYLTKPVDRQALLELVAQYTDASDGSAEEPREKPAGNTAAWERPALKILLVDDHRTACTSMARLLEMSGYEVRTAFDGKSAIAAAQNFDPGALILDIKLPDMSGYELLKRLREEAGLRSAKSIALTGYDEETASKDINMNFDHFLMKPVDIGRLEALLRQP